MAGINPATGQFDPYYYPPTTYTGAGDTYQSPNGTFVNPTWTMSGPDGGAPVTSPTAPAAATPQPETPQQPASDPVADYYKKLWEEQQRQARETASVYLQNVLKTYGLDSLASSVDSLIQQWGTNTDLIALKLKETDAYKTRFAGLISLQQRGITDVRNESEYLALETSYRQVFREAGLGDFLGEAGAQGEFNKIADIVSKYSLSVNEVKDRITDAQRAAINTPPETLQALNQFYGIDTTQLVAWSLDPVATMNEINRKVNAGIAAGYAWQNGLDIASGTSEKIADMYGNNDISMGQLTSDIQNSRTVNDATQRLAFIDNENLSADEVVQSTMGLDAEAAKKVGTLQSRERARFSGSSAVRTGSLSRNV